MNVPAVAKAFVVSIILAGLSACGGGGGGGSDDGGSTTPPTTTTPPTQTQAISGGGVKGPLANAIVTAYAFDSSQPGFKGAVAATGSTNASAAITGLALPFPISPPYILEFTSDAGTTDITTGVAPVITTMRTVMTQSLLDSGQQIYATPLTTMAVDIAVGNAADTNGTAGIQADEFEAALALAASRVVSTLGFGLDSSVDIFDTPPLVDSTTGDAETQTQVAAYRSAVEAVTAIAYQIDQQASAGGTDNVLAELAADLADGGIDGSAGSVINSNTLQVLEQDPASLPIPNSPTGQKVSDVQAILVSEKATTGSTTPTAELEPTGSIKTAPAPAQTNPDLDNDGVLNADDDYPNDATADTDTDGDGAPDVAYTDAGRSTVDTARSDADDDNDGWADTLDDYPLDSTRFLDPALDRDSDTVANGSDNCPLISNSDQTDTDADGRGDACSNDNDGDGVIDSADNCPLIANPGQEDLDGDDVPGTGGGDACDDDIDGDTVANGDDAFPLDGSETIDTDGDGIGNEADADDDNDGVADGSDSGVAPAGAPFVGEFCSLLRDCDGDGVLDGADYDPVNAAVTFNFAPVASGSSVVTDEDQAAAATLSVTDDGVAPGALVYNILSGPANGSLSGTAPNLTYTPDADYSGADSFTFNAVDAGGKQSGTATVSITVNAVNDAPVATDDSATTDEDTPITTVNVLANDTDTEGDSLSVVAGDPTATNGTVVNNGDGTFTYTPNPNYSGGDAFAYTVVDGNGGTDAANVVITVNPVNDAPAAVDDTLVTDEDTAGVTVDVTLNDTDAEGDGLSVSAFDAVSVAGGSVADNGGNTFSYTPAADFNGVDSFTYTVADGNGGSAIGTVQVTVNAVNDDPVAVDDSATTDEDTPITTVNVLANDSDVEGDSLSVVAGDPTATNGTVVNNGDGTFTYTPNANYSGGDAFAYTVVDGQGGTSAANVLITVNPVNDDPVANADADSTDEDTPFTTLNVLTNDTDGGDGPGALSVTAFDGSSANGGSVSSNGDGTFDYSPAADFNGDDTFTYTVSDTEGSAVGTVTISVNPVNDAPVGNADAAGAAVSVATDVDVLANDSDVDGDSLTITAVTQGSRGSTVTHDGSVVTFTDTVGAGTETFTYDLFDGTTTVSGILVTMTVTANAPPVANADSATTDEDTLVTTGNVLANDTDGGDGNALSITAFDASSANGGSVSDNGDGSFDFTPAADFNGDDTFTYTVSDGFSTAIGTVTVTVNPVNDDPVANADADSTDEDTPFTTLNVLTNDTDGGDGPGALSVTAFDATSTSGGSVSSNGDGSFDYTPAADFNGDDTFTYTVSDGSSTAVATVTITVNPVNDAPVAVDDAAATDQNTLVVINVLGNDTDIENDTLSVAAGDPVDAANGIATNNNDGTFDYVPDPDYVGSDSFTYTVNDGNGGSDVGTVTITVNPPGAVATVANLLAETQGGGVGAVESWNGTLPEFEYWRDVIFDATPGTLSFIDKAYDYDTQAFVDVGGFDSYWLTSTGTWELPSTIDVVTPNDGDGSMVVAVRDAADTETVASIRIRAFTQDIEGNLMSDYLDANWSAQLTIPAATFGAGAQLVTSYSFEDLTDSYSFELEDWCEFENPTRYAALNDSCNGVYINSTDSYAISLAELQVATAWTDTNTIDDSLLDTVSLSFNEASNAELLAELVVAGNVVNFYVRDYDLTGADYIVKLAETTTWSQDSVSLNGGVTVEMIRFTIPAALQSQFPDLGEEGGLNPFFTEFGGFVRGGIHNQAGNITADANLFNGIALDEVLGNFDAPAAPDVTELIGTWVSDSTSTTYGDPTVLHYFASFHYEVSGSCDADGSIGLEYGTMNVNVNDGTFTTSTSVNGRGACSLANVAGPGTTLSVNGDTLTLDVSGQITTFSRLKGDLNPLVGSWLAGDISVGGDGGHVLLSFFADGTYMHSEDCSVDGVGTEYGSYSWDEGNTNQVATSQVYDANGIDPGCGLSENTVGDWELSVVGDTLTVTVPLEGSFDFTRHSPALVPITPPVAFVEPGATTLYNVELDDDTGDWVMQAIAFDGAGNVTVDVGGPGEDVGTYAVIGGILEITGSGDLVDYVMIMSVDGASGANRVCWTDPYADLVNCSQPGSAFLFDNSTEANNFLNARLAGATFSGAAVNASTVFGASALFSVELSDYEASPGNWVDTPGYFRISASGGTATDQEYVLIDGSWVENTDVFDIALTSSGWTPGVDWRLDTSSFADPAVTLSNVEGIDTLQQLTVTFEEMAIDGDPVFDYVEPMLVPYLVNANFSAGAKVYRTSVTFDNDYYYINDWGTDCDDGIGGNFGGNCNAAWLRTLDRGTGSLSAHSAAVDTSFLNDNTATIEVGWNGSMSLLAVFASGGVLEFWEVDWSGGSQAVQSGFSGTWVQQTIDTESLVFYEVPVELQSSYQVQGGDDVPAVFLSVQDSYLRFGEQEDKAGVMGEFFLFNLTAFGDIDGSLPTSP